MNRRKLGALALAASITVLGLARLTAAAPVRLPHESINPVAGDRIPSTMRQLADGTTMIAGSSTDETGAAKMFTLRYDASGNVLSDRLIALPCGYIALAIDARGGIFVAASSDSENFWVMKYDGISGQKSWFVPAVYRGAAGMAANPSAIAVDGNNNLFITGPAYQASGRYDYATLKLDGLTGSIRWAAKLFDGDGSGDSVPTAIAVDASDNVAVTGYTLMGSAIRGATLLYDGVTGDRHWGPATFDAEGDGDIPVAVVASAPVIFSGAGLIPPGPVTSMITVSFNSSGPSGYGYGAMRYDGMTGLRVWSSQTFRTGGATVPRGLALDPAGNAYLAGYAPGTGGHTIETVKLAAASGLRVWGPVRLGGSSFPVGITADSRGVVVSGYMLNADGNHDFATVRYDALGGGTSWGPVLFDGKACDIPVATTRDGRGNVIVTGFSSSGGHYSPVTIKYEVGSGKTMWQN
jgi:hypothetical protein